MVAWDPEVAVAAWSPVLMGVQCPVVEGVWAVQGPVVAGAQGLVAVAGVVQGLVPARVQGLAGMGAVQGSAEMEHRVL